MNSIITDTIYINIECVREQQLEYTYTYNIHKNHNLYKQTHKHTYTQRLAKMTTLAEVNVNQINIKELSIQEKKIKKTIITTLQLKKLMIIIIRRKVESFTINLQKKN